MTAPCYTCEYRGTVLGSAHSSCNHPIFAKDETLRVVIPIAVMMHGSQVLRRMPHFELDVEEHGIVNGYFSFPVDFDPVWLNNCKGKSDVSVSGSGSK